MNALGRTPIAWRRWAAIAAVLVTLGAVFALYLEPAFLVLLADQVWACF